MPSLDETEIAPAGVGDLPAIASLAGVIWRTCYPGVISREQIEYMLDRMYARETLIAEIRAGVRFDRLLLAGELVGFASYGPRTNADVIKLHKLYLVPNLHGAGFGSRLLRHVMSESAKAGGRHLVLTVNKRNGRAIAAYHRNGFVITESVTVDIGGGFVMDDHVMMRSLGADLALSAREAC